MIPSAKEVNVELDAVVCRLMKLAIRSSGQHCAPPPQWMQRKLYDLLTLTEKAIERRRARFIRNFAGIGEFVLPHNIQVLPNVVLYKRRLHSLYFFICVRKLFLTAIFPSRWFTNTVYSRSRRREISEFTDYK